LHFRRATQLVRFFDSIGLGLFRVIVCNGELAVIVKQLGKAVMGPKSDIVPVERGCDSEGRLEMVDRFLFFSFGLMYSAKDLMKLTDNIFSACLRDECESTGCGVLCRVESFILKQQPSEVVQRPCLVFRSYPFENFRSFLSLS
jgi:hypothetical protein